MPNVEIEEYSFRDAYTGCAISPRPHARPLISQYHRVRTIKCSFLLPDPPEIVSSAPISLSASSSSSYC